MGLESIFYENWRPCEAADEGLEHTIRARVAEEHNGHNGTLCGAFTRHLQRNGRWWAPW